MSSSSANSFDQFGDDSPTVTQTRSFDDGYLAPPSFPNFDSTGTDSHPPIYVSGEEFTSDPAYFSSETNDNVPILPPPAEMEREECYALREWRRQNTIRLEKKEKREKELLSQIIDQADEYKVEFHRKRQANCETKRVANREKEQVFVDSQKKFHAEADKDHWKSIAEIIPKEVPTVGKTKNKKEEDKKAPIVVVQGPKPGKPSDLSRMRQILLKLKHDTPPHLKQSPAPSNATTSSMEAIAIA